LCCVVFLHPIEDYSISLSLSLSHSFDIFQFLTLNLSALYIILSLALSFYISRFLVSLSLPFSLFPQQFSSICLFIYSLISFVLYIFFFVYEFLSFLSFCFVASLLLN
jgi:hypothetical protein